MMNDKKKQVPAKLSEDKLTVEYDIQDFDTNLPHLAGELKDPNPNSPDIVIDGVLHESKPQDPVVYDFLQRCQTKEEALEIVSYMRNRDEISPEEENRIISQLENQGIRSFGPLRTKGYYERMYRKKKFNQ